MNKTIAAATAAVVALGFGLTSDAEAGHYKKKNKGRVYEVLITNITPGQILSPPVVVTHKPTIQLFEVGMPASAGVAAIAEDGDNMPLINAISGLSQVSDVEAAGGPVMPGASVTVEVTADRKATRLSAIGMLVITNDAFFAANSVELPRRGSVTYRAVAYDSGTEANTESCAHIPGPPCGNPFVRVTNGAEGFVHIHNGIHGIADLSPSQHDWRNPVVQITIRRIR